jgi:hypothetical protein
MADRRSKLAQVLFGRVLTVKLITARRGCHPV